MTGGSRTSTLLAAAAVSAALAGCGDGDTGDPIPGGTADALIAQLSQFKQAIDLGDCDSIDTRIQAMRSRIATLDEEGVGGDVQDALGDGVARLRNRAVEACNRDDAEVETTPIETTPTETETTETTPQETVPQTTPEPEPEPEPVPIPEPDPVPEPDPDQGGGGQQFDPNNGGIGPDGNGPPGQRDRGHDR